MQPNQDQINLALAWLTRNRAFFWSVYRTRYGSKERIESYRPLKGADVTETELAAESSAQLNQLLAALADINGLRIEGKPALKAPDATMVVWDIVAGPAVTTVAPPQVQLPAQLNGLGNIGLNGLSGIDVLNRIEDLSKAKIEMERKAADDRVKLLEDRFEIKLKQAMAESEYKRREDELKRREQELKEFEAETQDRLMKYTPLFENVLGKLAGKFIGSTNTHSLGSVSAKVPEPTEGDPLAGLTEVQRANYERVNNIAMAIISRLQTEKEVVAMEKILDQVLTKFESARNVSHDEASEERAAV